MADDTPTDDEMRALLATQNKTDKPDATEEEGN